MKGNERMAWMWLPANRDPTLDVAVPGEPSPSFGAYPGPARR
jgi:hypothetical protein